MKRVQAKKGSKKAEVKPNNTGKPVAGSTSNYAMHSIEKALRIPRAVLEQNVGKEYSKNDAAKFVGLAKSHGPFDLEVSSELKFGFLEMPSPIQLKPTELVKKFKTSSFR